MAGKKITIDVDGSGKMHIDYEGFIGNACFAEADKLKAALSVYGVDVETVKADPKKNEVEVRKLESTAKVAG